MAAKQLTLSLCGDVMLGRGVDQVLGHPGDPRLAESYVRDARRYVDLAEVVNGPIPAPVDDAWPWGDALEVLGQSAPDVRIVNLETAITRAGAFDPEKGVHYRMHPANIGALTVAAPDVCVLANNHVLDFGADGLLETLDVLASARIRTTGAGCDLAGARRPAVVDLADGPRVLVAAVAAASSGVPSSWAAGQRLPGVDRLARLTAVHADALTARLNAIRRPGDVVVVSVHWGPNWGYPVAPEEEQFAHRLVDGGVDVVLGHSSHHPKRVEVYRDRLVLYGTGDFIDDYEGISGYEEFRDDLRLLFLPTLEVGSGRLTQLRVAVFQARRMRLERASEEDTRCVRDLLRRLDAPAATSIDLADDGLLMLRPRQAAGRA
jgi:poly-gamma-glutamate synthesis protein (capsule biosynthesis protein)